MNIVELEARTKSYSLWLNAGDVEDRKQWLLNYQFDDAKLQKRINCLNMECDLLRRSEYPSQEEVIDALLYSDTEKLDQIKAKRAEVDQKYPSVSLD